MDDATPSGPIWHGATVLVVDHDPVMRKLVRRTLEAEEFHVEEAEGGESALNLIQQRERPFDLVLTDLSMPGIDGRQVSEALARYRPSVAVLCMSADPDSVPRIGASDTPVRVMLKPFNAEDLYHAVRDAITRSADLTAIAEDELVLAHAGLSRFARALEASRTTRVHTLDLVVAARELRRLREPGYGLPGGQVRNEGGERTKQLSPFVSPPTGLAYLVTATLLNVEVATS